MKLRSVSAYLKRNFVRAGAAVGALASTAGVSFAQESSNIDLSAASTAVDEMATAVKTFFTGDMLDAILMVIGAGFVLFAVFVAIKLIRRGTRSAV